MASASSGYSVVPAVCVGIAACAAAIYVLWGPDYLFRKKGCCPGLLNLGNTCFINAILQSLASLPRVCHWLKTVVILHKHRLGQALRDILDALNEDYGSCSPAAVLRALTMHRWKINHEQQDPHELYHVLLATLWEEMVTCPSFSDVLELLKDKEQSEPEIWTRSGCITKSNSALPCPLKGMLVSELHCIKCNHSLPVKYESFSSLSLTLPQYKCSLENCLLEFVKSEVVYDVHCPHCSESCGLPVKQNFLKKLALCRAPACLCIHFNRNTWLPQGFLHKNSLHISFPVKLNAGQLLSRGEPAAGLQYLLCAVVEHVGGASSGHYLTYRRCGSRGKQWVCASDTTVYSVKINQVLNAEAYMLFYESSPHL